MPVLYVDGWLAACGAPRGAAAGVPIGRKREMMERLLAAEFSRGQLVSVGWTPARPPKSVVSWSVAFPPLGAAKTPWCPDNPAAS